MVGQTIGSYRIVSQIGEGAMGRVYLAEHRHLKRKAALKLLTRDLVDRPDLVERFFLEARATSAIEHPGIVRIFDCEVDPNGQPYIVMEYLEGETLAAFLARLGPLPPANVARLGQSMAEALEAAHVAGIVHRDLKPENIFVRTQPADSIKLVDFGIAKLAGDLQSGQVHKTRSGILMGTPLYMSPEQCRDSGRIDFRTDIYSLGCVMFEMLTGHPPFVREGLGDLVVAHLTEQPQDVRELIPSAPAPLADLIGQLLRKDPAQRPENMREIARRLAIFVGGLTTIRDAVAPAAAAAAAPSSSPPPRVMTARPSVTTFEHSASEVLPAVDELPATNRRGPLVVGALLTVAAVGAGLFLLKSRVSSDGLADGPALAANSADAAPARVAAKPEGATETEESNPSAAGKADSASKRLIASAKKSATKHASNASVTGEPTKLPRAVDAVPVGPARSGPATSPPKETAPPSVSPGPSAPSPAPTSTGTTAPIPSSAPVPAIVAPAAPAAPPAPPAPSPSGELTGAWEGPWEDVAKQQKGRLYLHIAPAGAVTGWMFNRAAKESFRLIGSMTPRGDLDLTCKCPPQQGFVARGSIRQNGSGELTGRLALSTGAVVFGDSQLTLRRTTQMR